MTKHLGTIAILALATCSFAAHATAPSQAAPDDGVRDAPAAVEGDDDVEQAPRRRFVVTFREAERPAPDQDIRKDNCLRFTGSRLIRDDIADQRCAHGPGVVLMLSDIDLGSAGTLADFVRR